MTQSTVDQELFESEYEHSAVPLNKRKSLLSVTSIWVGFPMIITGAVTGATLVHGLGFKRGILAMLLGNVLLFAYVGLLSMLGAKDGNNFSLQASRTFGRKGYMVSSALLSTLVIGWFAVQTGLTGVSMSGAFDVSTVLIVVLAGIFYVALTLLGIKALSIIGMISAPLFLILGIYSVSEAAQNGHAVASYAGNAESPIAFWVAVTLVFALFADSGTMTADFTRWAKNGKHAAIATFAAFPVANLIAMVIGGIIAAATLTGSGDVFGVIVGKGGAVTWIAVIFLFVNLGSVCSHCLYNGAVGWSHITGTKMRTMTFILGIIGIVAAALGIWNYFVNWLNLLGVIVPPIGTIILMDQLVTRRTSTAIDTDIRYQPFLAWGIGSAAALIVNYQFPSQSTAITGMLVSAAAYWLVSKKSSVVASPSVTARR
ncbi:cytosine permease [Paenibacillus glycanilyticus]|uniref:Cytosine permease n=1 Tax=Paenibacillus glycanilyticus TaxID=126569 RepID=A0ABQ6NEI8_9BACL|nr:cytosine permease [Paenibacillus glycanilyticus]GMK43461.1 cytosine permease [Paenibacillus glycanilyticus]